MLDLTSFKIVFSRSNASRKLWITICIILLQLVCSTLVCAQCRDASLCSFMASEGECENDPVTMLQECPKACKNPCLCAGISQDTACDCLVKAKNGYCTQPGALTECQSTCTQVTHESCPLLPIPGDPNARLSTWSTNYLTTVTEVCVPGFAPLEPDNQGKKTCSSGQRWVDDPYNGTPVECTPIDCGPPPTAPNAFSVPADTTFGGQADYSCARGYVHVQGQKTLTCNASALWEGELIVCRKMDCGSPPPSANASFKVVNASSGQTATYTCSVGFRRSQGDITLRCNSTGVWQGILIVCTVIDCGPPPSPSNAEVTVKDTTYGKTVNFTCMDGYTRVQGHDVIICNTSGAWDPEPLVCESVSCGPPPMTPSADVAMGGTNYNDMANYTCKHGYAYEDGDEILRCDVLGLWEGVLISCTKVNCGQPPSAPHTDMTVNNTSYGDTANYTCTRGYAYDDGDMTLTCGSQGSWEGVLMSCTSVSCGPPPTTPSADVAMGGTNYDDMANYTCKHGYAYEDGDEILRCDVMGLWEGVLISCTKINCGQPPSAPHTDMTVNNTSYGDTANYTCTRGYAYDDGDMTLTCGSQGSWEGVLMSCTRVTCGRPPSAPHTDMTVNNTSFGDTANYTCTRGYAYDDGDMTLTCGSQGSWEGVLMSCTKINCGQPPSAPHTDMTVNNTSFGDTANYTCTRGYAYDDGDMTLTCGSQGSWDGVLMSCIRVACGQPPSAPHTDIAVGNTSFGDTANYTCTRGYAYDDGDMTLTCGSQGSWEGVLMSCTIIDCGGPPRLAHTDVQISGTTFNQTANYSCQIGYLIQQGQSSLVCGLSGKWTGNALKCQIANCGPPPKGTNLVMSYTSTTFGQKVTYSCSARYKYSIGDRNLTCSQTGSWTGQLMTCIEKDCGVPEVYNSSDVRFTSTTAGSQAIYTCSAGSQRVEGDPKRICQEDETWSGHPVTCGPSGSENVPTSAHKKTLEAPVAWAIGVAIFAVLATVTVLCIVMDCGALRKNFRKDVTNSTSKIRLTTKWKPGSSKEARLVPSSSSGIPSVSSSSASMSSGTNYFHSGESLAKLNNLHPTHQTMSTSQSQLFPPSASPRTPRTSLSIPNSPSGITLSSLSETSLRNPMPDVGT